MAITLDGMSRPKSVTTNALAPTVAVGTVVETDTTEESFFIPIRLGSTDPASFTIASVTTVSGNATLTTTGAAFKTNNVRIGDVLSGAGIASGAVVNSISVDGNTLVMDQNASSSGTITLTVDPPAATPAIAAIKIVFSKAGSVLGFSSIKALLYDGTLGSVTAATEANAAKVLNLIDKDGKAASIDLDAFLVNFRVPRSA